MGGKFDFGVDVQRGDSSDLSENVAEDLVEYIRGNVISNESQGLLLFLGWLTGWFAEEEHYVNSVVIGSSSGGKTHLIRKLKRLIPKRYYYESTSSSDKGFVDDNDWEGTLVAILSEWQKLGSEVREFMKSVAGDDGGYTYARSVPDEDGPKGARKTDKIEKEPKPYSFSYAQYSMDLEMWNRLFKIYIDESSIINRAVARMHANHENIVLDDDWDEEYIYDTSELWSALSNHVRSLPSGAYVHLPEWVFYAVEPVLDINRAESKRVSAMVFNQIRASALLNYDERATTTTTVDGDTVEAYVVEPQDVANVLSCQDVLLGTTHELEPRKQEIVDAVRHATRLGDDSMALLEDIQAYFQSAKSDMSQLKASELRELLRELEENFIIRIEERYEGNAHGYEFVSLSQIGYPRLSGFDEFEYNSEEPFMGVEHPSNPFKDCVDPITGETFKESVESFRAGFKEDEGEKATMDVGEAMGDSEDESRDGTLGGFVDEDESVELEGPVEAVVHNLALGHSGERFPIEGLSNLHVLGLVEPSETLVATDTGGTILDPANDLWEQPDKPDDWITTEGEAEAAIDEAYKSLVDKNVISYFQVDEDTVEVSVKRDVE